MSLRKLIIATLCLAMVLGLSGIASAGAGAVQFSKIGEWHYTGGTTVVQYEIINHGVEENVFYTFSISSKSTEGVLTIGTYSPWSSTSTSDTLNIQLLGHKKYTYSASLAPQKKQVILVQVVSSVSVSRYSVSVELPGFETPYTDSFIASPREKDLKG